MEEESISRMVKSYDSEKQTFDIEKNSIEERTAEIVVCEECKNYDSASCSVKGVGVGGSYHCHSPNAKKRWTEI